jgi:hypothetical protein
MPRLRIIGKGSIASIGLLAALLVSSHAKAHVVWLDPPPRTTDAGLTTAPCGDKPMGASVVTYPAGTDIEITFNLSQQHTRTTHINISYDGFATSTQLAQGSTPESGVYKMTVPLPAQPLGPAVLQINHQNYYSCADITVGEQQEFTLNAGLNDAWYDPATDGQGFFITVFPVLGVMAVAWFTYDTDLPAEDTEAQLGDPGHRWLTAAGEIVGDQALLDISITSGGLFDTATDIERRDDGTLSVRFTNCNNGSIDYDIPSIGLTGTVPIQRVADDNIALCEALNNQ